KHSRLLGCPWAPADIDAQIASFDPAESSQPLHQCSDPRFSDRIVRVQVPQEANPPRARLLRARREGPHSRAAEQGNELAPSHSITSSARARRDGGTSRPSTFAVMRLMTKSNLVDW